MFSVLGLLLVVMLLGDGVSGFLFVFNFVIGVWLYSGIWSDAIVVFVGPCSVVVVTVV